MPDLQKLHENKERILHTIRSKGPSFPTRISKETEITPLFASAFLSELVSEKRLKLSNMKIGSSPLYFLEGQEVELENFVNYLNPREKEALFLLKESKILEDESQQPAIRVALRKIKDFAFPVTVRINGESKLFWRYFTTPESKLSEFLQNSVFEEKSPLPEEESNDIPQKKVLPKQEPKKTEESGISFSESVKELLKEKDIEILEEISAKKKEFISKVRVDTKFGKQQYFLIAKDKKKVNSNDLTISLQQAQTEKMPALFISPGDLDKKAREYLNLWRNLIKFEKIPS